MRSLLYIGILLSGFSCARNTPCLHPGDLLFQVGKTSEMTGAITAATGQERQLNYTHVGIAVQTGGVDSVLEATSDGGVRLTALGDFLERTAQIDGRPAVTVMRLRDTTGVAAAVERARKFIGQPYDYSFRPDNGKMYCSELVRESYLTPEGCRRFPARPMNFRAADGSLPRFWAELFAELGEEVPQDIPGTNPNDMAHDPQLKEVARYY
ncbi:YiiX/YebB-like N1pC/P60 family cysteine hydrolase [Alistipes sp.]|uniref:YiiX/YebB-like N1pC/P60 family cysteine hydrolase n=1 Tax=Alistipes sp. TaxID=1872444 RepID=UPI0025BD94EB|nr:YiiX/YebB-like N1pC/P60 family cysteine hydrolase [Alistipes sp.]